jgi:predicted N-acyltransferase
MESTEIRVSHSLSEITIADWDALGSGNYPFTRHCFLYGLELHDCLEPFGWHPVYFQIYRRQHLLAAIPCYIKTNSYGELVFDHAWENAYQRSGLDYYPKLVSAIPYTPATGERFLINLDLVRDDEQQQALRLQLSEAARSFCEKHKLSSWHILFAEKKILQSLENPDILLRNDVQFHWQNQGYRDFDDFLACLNSRKRKNIRKERRRVADHGLDISLQHGGELDAGDWQRRLDGTTLESGHKAGAGDPQGTQRRGLQPRLFVRQQDIGHGQWR